MNSYLLFFCGGLLLSLWQADAVQLLKGVVVAYLVSAVATGAARAQEDCTTFAILSVLGAIIVCLL